MKRFANKGFTLIEIMIVVAIIALLAAIAIPNVLRGRTSANESAAIGNIRAVISSLEMYRSVNNVYPDAWLNGSVNATGMYGNSVTGGCGVGVLPDPDFGPQPFCIDIQTGAAAVRVVQGYTYTFLPTTGASGACTNAAAAQCTRYTLLVTPQTTGRTGTRSFFTDETATIRHCQEPVSGAVAATTGGMVNDATLDTPPTPICA